MRCIVLVITESPFIWCSLAQRHSSVVMIMKDPNLIDNIGQLSIARKNMQRLVPYWSALTIFFLFLHISSMHVMLVLFNLSTNPIDI